MIRFARRSLIGSDLVIVVVSLFHIFEATVITFTDGANGSVGIAALLGAFHHAWLATLVLYCGSMSAIAGQWIDGLGVPVRLALILPQLALLFITASSAADAVLVQSYADGVTRPWTFIACDQAPRMMMPFFYFIATYARVLSDSSKVKFKW